jgi:hypothetical protein
MRFTSSTKPRTASERVVHGVLVHVGRRNAAFGRPLGSLPHTPGMDLRVGGPGRSRGSAAGLAPRLPYFGSTYNCAEQRADSLARARVPDHGVESQLDALDDVVDGNVRPHQPANGRPLILF